MPLGGLVHVPPYPELGNVVDEIAPITGRPGVLPAEFYEDTRKANIFQTVPPDRCRLLLNARVVAVERDSDDPQKIAALIARDVHTRRRDAPPSAALRRLHGRRSRCAHGGRRGHVRTRASRQVRRVARPGARRRRGHGHVRHLVFRSRPMNRARSPTSTGGLRSPKTTSTTSAVVTGNGRPVSTTTRPRRRSTSATMGSWPSWPTGPT